VQRPSPPLPDPPIGLAPPGDGRLHQPDEEPPLVVGRRVAALVPAPVEVEQFAVNVELELARGGIADPHRTGAPVPLEMVELDLDESPLPSHAEHDLELLPVAGGASHDEPPEALGLFGIAEIGQRSGAEDGVPDPAEAVVPVARAAGRLRERRGGGRDDAPVGR
jgi:hypothetical protein